jgi:A/G-specific adenine glycosylase
MAKRKRRIDSFSQDSTSDYVPEPTKRPAASRRKRRSEGAIHKNDHSTEEAPSETYVTPHSPSHHLISFPDLMRHSLLDWYAGVHQVRGMPWRKPFDPSLDADARAQRAYEVRHPAADLALQFKPAFCSGGVDFGSHASADTSCNRDSVLQQMDG